jgi:hypothetical protein
MSAGDLMLDGNFWICEQYKYIPDELWSPNKPDNTLNIETCTGLKLSLNDDEIGYDDIPCLNNVAKYFCEVIQKSDIYIFFLLFLKFIIEYQDY